MQSFKTVIVIIITAIIVGGGVYLWQQKPTQEIATEETQSEWQVINDTKIGYTIKYPANWPKAERDNGFGVSPGGGLGMSLQFYDKTENTKEELIGQLGNIAGTERSESRSEIKFNGIQATKVTVITSPPTPPITAVVLEAYGKIFVLQTSYSPDEFETFYRSFRILN